MKVKPILISILLSCFSLFAQKSPKKKIVEIKPVVEMNIKTGIGQLKLLTTFSNGKQRSTGFKKLNNIGWAKYTINVSNSTFIKGQIVVDKSLMTEKNHSCEIKISPKNNPSYVVTKTMEFPFVTKVSISLRNQIEYLPGEKFSLKIYYHYNDGSISDWSYLPDAEQQSLKIKFENYEELPNFLVMPDRKSVV